MSKNHNGLSYVKAAQKNNLQVVMGKGSHAKILAPQGRGYMIVPLHRELGNGLECSIRKWFKALGIILALAIPIICILSGRF